MHNYHLTPHGTGWKLTAEGKPQMLDTFQTKEQGVRCSGAIIGEREGGTGSLKIHKADGTIEEERTYPRSVDPSKSPG